MSGNYGVYYNGKIYGFETKEEMNKFILKIEQQEQKGIRKSN